MGTRREIEADIRPRRVMGRNLDGTVQVVPLNGECPENGGLDAQAGVIFTPSVFYGATLGTGPGTNQVVVSSGALRIDTYEPRFLRRGKSQTVQLTGAGFVPSMVAIPAGFLLDPPNRQTFRLHLPSPCSVGVPVRERVDRRLLRKSIYM